MVWAAGHVPHWLSMVVDPWRDERGLFAKDSPTTLRRLPAYLVSPRLLAFLDPPIAAYRTPIAIGAYADEPSARP